MMRTLEVVYRMSTRVIIPEMMEGNKLCQEGKFKQAESCFERAVEIMNYAKLDQQMDSDYVQSVSKLAGCQYLNKKYASATTISSLALNQIRTTNPLHSHLKLLYLIMWGSNLMLPVPQQHEVRADVEEEIKGVVMKLYNIHSETHFPKGIVHVPNIFRISEMLNQKIDYRTMLEGLVERSGKSQKAEHPQKQFSEANESPMGPQLWILYEIGTFVTQKSLTTADKKLLNNRVDLILKQYEKSRPAEVYKPLLGIITSLIVEKHYMSAEGMIGYLKNQELILIGADSEDRKLINNLYRMLVTRANNQQYAVGWEKEEKLGFGKLVIERLMKASLLDHPLDSLIC